MLKAINSLMWFLFSLQKDSEKLKIQAEQLSKVYDSNDTATQTVRPAKMTRDGKCIFRGFSKQPPKSDVRLIARITILSATSLFMETQKALSMTVPMSAGTFRI